MQPDTASISPNKPPRYHATRHPFDRRTKAARRYAELVAQFTEECGGASALTEAGRASVAQLASVIITAETMQAQIVRGETVDAEQLVRVANLQARLMRFLGIGQAKSGKQDPHDYIAGLTARSAAA